MTSNDHYDRMELYRRGLSDRKIAIALKLANSTVRKWRLNQKLPSNHLNHPTQRPVPPSRIDHYHAGLTDEAIAQSEGASQSTITHWRKRHGLPTHRPMCQRLPEKDRARRMLLYGLGWGDPAISRECGTTRKSVMLWRQANGLDTNFESGHQQRHSTRPTLEDVFKRVRVAIGRRLSPDVADDAAMDMFEAVLNGSINIDQIEATARKFGNRVLDQYASKYGPRSLDAEIGDGNFTLMDTLVDEGSSDWLERMGATVW